MTDHVLPPGIEDRWGGGPPAGADALDQLVYLSNLVGREPRLVQPGGGNTSVKIGTELFVKGSGTDLKTIDRRGFTRLSLTALARLREVATMSDPDMMQFMAGCMLAPGGPVPSVETPLHSLLPQRVIVHTHDVATMSLTNLNDALAERLTARLLGGEIVYVPYARPGFPLAHAMRSQVERIPPNAIGLALAHHGLVIWADDVRECYARLVRVVATIEAHVESQRRKRGTAVLGAPRAAVPSPDVRGRFAQQVLPVVRGALGASAGRVILQLDDTAAVLAALAGERVRELVAGGMTTPEHILRAGRRPLWLELDGASSAEQVAESVRRQIAEQRAEYEAYHARHAPPGTAPIADWAKVVLAPGLGMITAQRDTRGAATANLCYRAALESIANAEAIDAFQFLPEADVFEFEHWPLERRKLDEQAARDRATLLVPGQVAVVIGGASGIGRAAALRFAAEGAHVVVADLDQAAADAAAAEVTVAFPGRAVGIAADVRDDASLGRLFHQSVLAFGGVDTLFYTAGLPPRFAEITEIRREDLQRQLEVHYLGAVMAMGQAAAVMRRQGLGGAIVASVSKAALAPGREAVAYGGSKAALLQALRVAALELGGDGIRVNAINADQIETPLFRRFVAERAASRGVSVDEQLEAYRRRNAMGVSLIPPEVVADLAVLLASERFRYTTGDILTVDGGLPEAFPR
jgi:rhamnose utilization protein RhaD (predicted bifunctional aldolase and dehydrogenase)/NAD(P)-dependent dehydrogenase (short-subunit alcohol dehydrogenase family)